LHFCNVVYFVYYIDPSWRAWSGTTQNKLFLIIMDHYTYCITLCLEVSFKKRSQYRNMSKTGKKLNLMDHTEKEFKGSWHFPQVLTSLGYCWKWFIEKPSCPVFHPLACLALSAISLLFDVGFYREGGGGAQWKKWPQKRIVKQILIVSNFFILSFGTLS
jgi:hypothetical protein